MNTPGRAEDNWRWRCPEDLLSAPEIERLRDLTETLKSGGRRSESTIRPVGSSPDADTAESSGAQAGSFDAAKVFTFLANLPSSHCHTTRLFA